MTATPGQNKHERHELGHPTVLKVLKSPPGPVTLTREEIMDLKMSPESVYYMCWDGDGTVRFASHVILCAESLARQELTAAHMAANWWADRLQKGDKEKFINHLAAGIQLYFTSDYYGSEDDPYVKVEVDYEPMGILCEAVHAAIGPCLGLDCGCYRILPRKTMLRVYRNRLVPKEGYANWTAEIPVP